jgi:calcineurin-like phosphoesterase family protein
MKNKALSRIEDATKTLIHTLPKFVISDTHFNHTRLAEVYEREARMSLPGDHNRVMRERWQQTVGPEDTILHLGDVALGKASEFWRIADQLTGVKYMLDSGNHDKQTMAYYEEHGFIIVRDFEADYKGWRIRFSHWPDYDKKFIGKGPKRINVHGHVHSKTLDDPRYINTSVEVIGFCPQPLTKLLDERIKILS